MLSKWISFMVVLLMATTSVVFASTDKYNLENQLTQIGQLALDNMFGGGNFILRVGVQMTESKYKVTYTQQSNPKSSKKKDQKGKQVYILPGVPALKNIAPDAFNQLPYDSVTSLVSPEVKHIYAKVIVNKSYPRSKAKKAEKMLKDTLGLKEGRDKIELIYQKFYYNPNQATQNIIVNAGKENLISYQNIFNFLFALLLLVAILGFRTFQKHLLEALGKTSEGGGGARVTVNPSLELPEGMRGGRGNDKLSLSGGSKIKIFFDFIDESNVDNFIFLLKKENIGLDYVSMIVSFLPSNIGSKVLNALSVEEKSAIAATLIDQRLGNRQLLEKLEIKLKQALECFMGGENNVQKLFDSVSGEDKKEILQTLETTNPTAYEKIRPHVLMFDDLSVLQDEELKLLLSDINLELLATSLVASDQQLYQRFESNLTKNAKDMVNQYLELKSDSTSKKDIEAAQDYLLKIAKRLDEAGSIHLHHETEDQEPFEDEIEEAAS